jgi:hypothetical protein
LSRPERSFSAAGAALKAEELAGIVVRQHAEEAWQQAIACYFAGADGWREAQIALGGAFASDAAAASRVSNGKSK